MVESGHVFYTSVLRLELLGVCSSEYTRESVLWVAFAVSRGNLKTTYSVTVILQFLYHNVLKRVQPKLNPPGSPGLLFGPGSHQISHPHSG